MKDNNKENYLNIVINKDLLKKDITYLNKNLEKYKYKDLVLWYNYGETLNIKHDTYELYQTHIVSIDNYLLFIAKSIYYKTNIDDVSWHEHIKINRKFNKLEKELL